MAPRLACVASEGSRTVAACKGIVPVGPSQLTSQPLVRRQQRLEVRPLIENHIDFARKPEHRSELLLSAAAGVTDFSRSSVGLIRSHVAAIPRTIVAEAAPLRIGVRFRCTHAASPGIASDRARRRLRGSEAGTRTSVSAPHSSMLRPISRPSCSRLGKSTNDEPVKRRGQSSTSRAACCMTVP